MKFIEKNYRLSKMNKEKLAILLQSLTPYKQLLTAVILFSIVKNEYKKLLKKSVYLLNSFSANYKILPFLLILFSLSACKSKIDVDLAKVKTIGPEYQDTVNLTVAITSPAVSSYVNIANVSTFTVQGTCSDIGTGNVKILNGVSELMAVDCAVNNTWQASLNLTAITDGALTLKAVHNDIANNAVETTRLFYKDVVAPATAWIDPLANACMGAANAGSFTIEGSCTTADGNVTIASAQLTPSVSASCTAGSFSSTLNLSTGGLADLANFSINISQTDTAGNQTLGARSFKYIGAATPTIVFGGWDDVYAIGKKTYRDGNATENGVVKLKWKDWPASNTCQPNKVKLLRGSDTISSGVEYEEVAGSVKQVTDTSLVAADFGKAWYYSLKVEIVGNDYDVVNPVEIQKIRVIAPPDNMALVHRWIANQETCGLIGKTTDPTNNYRCNYEGQGKIVRSTVGYNDMEHDILVDRFQTGCNISSTCGAGSNTLCSSENFLQTENPTASGGVAGAIGSVYYVANGTTGVSGKCWYKTGALATNWVELNGATTPQILASTTSEAHAALLSYVSQTKANQACSAQTLSLTQVENYSDNTPTTFPLAKRLLRQKEWRAAASWDRNMSFPSVYGTLDNYINSLEAGATLAGDPKGLVGKCNTNNTRHGSLTAVSRGFLGGFTPHKQSFETGSKIATIDCQSRYGIQDMVGNIYEWASDQLSCPTTEGDTCIGQTSTLDAGNTDMLSFKFDGFQGPGDRSGVGDGTFTINDWVLQSAIRNGTTYYNPILGLPLMSNTGVNIDSVSIADWITSNLFHNDNFYLSPSNGNSVRGLLLGGSWNGGTRPGRWLSLWAYSSANSYSIVGGRCALPVN